MHANSVRSGLPTHARLGAALGALVLMSLASPAPAAPPADWSVIPVNSIKLFYPGQSSYEWLLSKEHRRADRKVAEGDSCISCHEGEEAEIGNLIVSGERLEPTPIAGKQGTINLALQIAFDDTDVYLRARWKTRNPHPGEAHPFKRFDGQKWEHYGYPKLDEVVRTGKQPGIYEDRFSMLIDDGRVENFAAQGCWLTCHDGQRDMPGDASPDAVRANPVIGDAGLKKKDVRKYLPSTRKSGDWADTRSVEDIAGIKSDGGFLDLMQWRAHRSNPVGMADDFYVLEYRLGDDGKGPFNSNWDSDARQPKLMYDAARTGSNAMRIEQIRSRPTALVREANTVPFDPGVGWKEGNLIPAYYTSRADAGGSAADNADARGTWANGEWTVVWRRPMGLAEPDDKALVAGGSYTFAFAVHDDNITTRGHHVSWPMSVGFGVAADIAATRLP